MKESTEKQRLLSEHSERYHLKYTLIASQANGLNCALNQAARQIELTRSSKLKGSQRIFLRQCYHFVPTVLHMSDNRLYAIGINQFGLKPSGSNDEIE